MNKAHEYPQISAELLAQLLQVAPSEDQVMEYFPCRVTLRDGRVLDRVYVAEAGLYIRAWGVWPEEDKGKQSVSIRDVIRIEESPSRLPRHLANKMYAAGESGMGYCIFVLQLRAGRRLYCLTGGAVDFVTLPDGVTREEIVDLMPHEGLREWHLQGALPGDTVESSPYYWCLYSLPPADKTS